MSGFNGSGTYVRGYNWVNDAANAIDITASRVDADMADVVNAFNICLTRDGQGKPSADFNFNGFGGINLKSGTAAAPSLSWLSGTNDGFYLITATQIGVAVGGSNVATFDSSGIDNTIIGGTAAAAGYFTTLASSGVLTASGTAYTPTVAVVAATTTTIDCSKSNVFRVTMGTNVTTLTVSNPKDGQTINIRFKQDATGSRTLAWPASFRWNGGVAQTLSTAANAEDFMSAQYDATDGTFVAGLMNGVQ